MIKRFRNYWQIGKNMGFYYVLFRLWYSFKSKSGLLKWQYPTSLSSQAFVSVGTWRSQNSKFFKSKLVTLNIAPNILVSLQKKVEKIQNNQFQHFSDQWHELSGWHTNPITGYKYSPSCHWTKIQDFSKTAGDIKYVWEKSRFSFLFDIEAV